jgi:pimeloyl-ACP methyl ester carboxylesterase
MATAIVHELRVPVAPGIQVEGELTLPAACRTVVVFAHGSGSSRHSSRNQYVARALNEGGLGTLLFDLLTPAEEELDMRTGELRFNIPFLAERIISATEWLAINDGTANLSIAYFGASTGGGAALMAAAERGDRVVAVVSRGGRPDLAADALPRVTSPTLLIVGGGDEPVIEMNRWAMDRMKGHVKLLIVPGATHLFEEPGALEQVAELARDWFREHEGG